MALPPLCLPALLRLGIVSLLALAAQAGLHAAGIRNGPDAMVLAILIGAGASALVPMSRTTSAGVQCTAKPLLEIAVVLLGASMNVVALIAAGPALVGGIVAVVVVALGVGYAAGRMVGLPPALAALVACGNAICGNSAIAAAAAVLRARAEEITTAITFTALVGVAVVVALPFLQSAAGLDPARFGVLAGLTVYAVPQVIAATAQAGSLATQLGVLVKLTRVLMLGPVLLLIAVAGRRQAGPRLPLHMLVPWFVPGFIALMAARGFGFIDEGMAELMNVVARDFTLLAMAGLGLLIDLRALARSGGRVIAAAFLAFVVLAASSTLLLAVIDL
ncbi:putative sulfate exporter family transporter [Aureimonas flava]|uniref:Putative sulfate exporter family transporter n=1 Tax=Aureimonas flava TaxID=2320271 RepID=A0A3A1WMB9_9HYPH|nr:putative sulfate exporter family transporter [Aureimonas flava]RIY02001.1 putative sulfate exporter family transporter [Aureimonas flava]